MPMLNTESVRFRPIIEYGQREIRFDIYNEITSTFYVGCSDIVRFESTLTIIVEKRKTKPNKEPLERSNIFCFIYTGYTRHFTVDSISVRFF